MTQKPENLADASPVMIFGTRASDLALWQTKFVVAQLKLRFPHFSMRERLIQTRGDLELEKSLPEIGGKGLFTEELDRQLLSGEIDCAVHSLKDLPTTMMPGIRLGAILHREDPRDVWICPAGFTIYSIPSTSRVGTSSVRRQAQILALRPDLEVQSIRGNVPTRIEKVRRGDFDAIVIAAAGVIRLGLAEFVTQWLSLEEMLPAPGQGALAVACREADPVINAMLAEIHEPSVARCTSAERGVLAALGGGCSAPVAAWAEPLNPSTTPTSFGPGQHPTSDVSCSRIRLCARVFRPDGTHMVSATGEGHDSEELGDRIAGLLREQGANQFLDHHHAGSSRSTRASRLTGRRIAITRAIEDAEPFAALLREQGAEPIRLPVIRYLPLPTPDLETQIRQLKPNDWIVLTSVTALRYLQQKIHNLAEVAKGLRFACVGSVTADSVTELGLSVAFVPETFTGRSLANTLPLGEKPGTVLWLRPLEADAELFNILSSRGATVHECCLYATERQDLGAQQRQMLRQAIDVVTFASSSAVNHFFDQLDAEEQAWVSCLELACIGPVTAETLLARGFNAAVQPKEHTLPALVQAMADFFESSNHLPRLNR